MTQHSPDNLDNLDITNMMSEQSLSLPASLKLATNTSYSHSKKNLLKYLTERAVVPRKSRLWR